MKVFMNNFSIENKNQSIKNKTNFKSTFASMHWIAEKGGNYYTPVQDRETINILQRKLMIALSKKIGADKNVNSKLNNFVRYVKSFDKDFKKDKYVRSFYDFKYECDYIRPRVFFITGKDVNEYNKIKFPDKNIKYNFKHIIDTKNMIKDENDIPLTLHSKFEIVRNAEGDILNYKFCDAKFLPSVGSENPISRYNSKKS